MKYLKAALALALILSFTASGAAMSLSTTYSVDSGGVEGIGSNENTDWYAGDYSNNNAIYSSDNFGTENSCSLGSTGTVKGIERVGNDIYVADRGQDDVDRYDLNCNYETSYAVHVGPMGIDYSSETGRFYMGAYTGTATDSKVYIYDSSFNQITSKRPAEADKRLLLAYVGHQDRYYMYDRGDGAWHIYDKNWNFIETHDTSYSNVYGVSYSSTEKELYDSKYSSTIHVYTFNQAPTVNSTDYDPDNPVKGDLIDTYMNASDSDGDDLNAWLTVEENGTVINDSVSMNEPSTNEFQLLDVFKADKTGVYYNMTFTVGDGSSNTTKERSFKLTDTAPSVSLIKPSGTKTEYKVNYSADVTDNDGVDGESISCDFKVNGNVVASHSGTEDFSFNGTLDQSDYSAKSNSLDAVCTDPEGHTGSDSGSFYAWRGLNVSTFEDDAGSKGSKLKNWSIYIENSTDTFSDHNLTNPSEWEYDTIPSGDLNITVSDGSDQKYYFNSSYQKTVNSTIYEEFDALLKPKPENKLSLKSDPGWLINDGEEFTITATADEGESKGTLTVEGREVSNPYTATLDFGIYPVNWSVPETKNYRPTYTSNTLQVLSTGFGATSNTTMAFKYRVEPTSNPYLVNFSSFIKDDQVRESLGDVYVPHENVSLARTGSNNQLLEIDHSNYSGSKINLTWGNYYANRSYPTTSKPSADTLQLGDAQYKEINPYYVLTYNLEQTGKNKLPPNANVTTSLLSDSGVTSYRVEDKRYLVAAREQVDEIETTVQYSATDIYQRNVLPTSKTEYKNIWLVDANKNQVVELLLEKRDQTGNYGDAFVRIKKSLGGAKRTITEQYFDAEDKTVVYLINGEKYTVEVVSNDRENIRTIGNLYVDTVDLTKTIRIQELSSLDPDSGNMTYNLYQEGTQVKLDFSSPSDQNNNVTLKVWNYTDGEAKNLLYENTVSDVSTANLNFDANASYNASNLSVKAQALIESEKFGDIDVSQLFTFDADVPIAGIDLPADTLKAAVVFLITVTPMFFNPKLARLAAALQVLEAAFFALVLGWIDIGTAVMSSGGTIAFAGILVLIESWNESPASQSRVRR